MAVDFFIPKLGDNVKEATIVNWLVEDGVQVNEGDEILEVETDKAVVPIPANASGYLHIGPYKAGDVVAVSAVVATIGQPDKAFAPDQGEAAGANVTQAKISPPAVVEKAESRPEGTPTNGAGRSVTASEPNKVTPVAQKMAVEMGVDLRTITGSGEHDRITKEDVVKAATPSAQPVAQVSAPEPISAPAPSAQPQPQPTPPPQLLAPQPEADVLEHVPLKGIRATIARRMAESVQTTARVTLVTEVDATEFVALREKLKARFSETWGFTLGYNDLLALIVANALRKFPYMNARLSAAGDTIEHLAAVNMGMAVDTDRGLLVTVIRNADTKGLQQFGVEFRAMVERARVGKSTPDDLSGGTFTITNLGMYRVDAFTPVINLPEAAILGVGRITPKPVVKGGEIVARQTMTLSLVFDHRLADGAPAARFLDHICELIEEPYLLFLTTR